MNFLLGTIRSLSLAMLLVGLVFRIMHWPGGEIMLVVGLVVFVGASVLRFLLRR